MSDIVKKNENEIPLTPEVIRKYICRDATDKEVFFFLELCKAQGLNPFLEEAYLIKYSKDEPASIVVSKDAFLKRAGRLPVYNGFRAGIIVLDNKSEIVYREGSLIIPGETLLGGWAVVYRKDWDTPIRAEVSLLEYQKKNRGGDLSRPWKEMPATMIRKVAVSQAHREAFPEELGKLYTPEEILPDSTSLPKYRIDQEIESIAQPIQPPQKIINEEKTSESRAAENELAPPPVAKTIRVEQAEDQALTPAQQEVMDALLTLYDGDMEKALDRLEKETAFKSKRTGEMVRGTRRIDRLKDVSCKIVLRQIKPELEQKSINIEAETDNQDKKENDFILCSECKRVDDCEWAVEMKPGDLCPKFVIREKNGKGI